MREFKRHKSDFEDMHNGWVHGWSTRCGLFFYPLERDRIRKTWAGVTCGNCNRIGRRKA